MPGLARRACCFSTLVFCPAFLHVRYFCAQMNSDSRSIVVVLAVLLCSAFCFGKDARPSRYLLYVGTYTDKGAKGIYVYHYDPESGQLSDAQVAAETVNPSFVTIDDKDRRLYAVNEVQKYQNESSGGVSAFSIQPDGQLHFLNEVASGGADPCY